VVAVIVYHLGLGWAGGGYLGVDLFFVLSGFLITGLLVEERVATGGISLPRFYARRARRLFPALLLVVTAVVLYAAAGGPNVDPQALRGDVVGTLFYFANWHFIAVHNPYFAPFTTPSPLEHTWSLAIEEQFYVIWPLLLLILAKLGGRDWRRFILTGAAVVALASVLDMALQAHGASDISRAYFGTDTRAFELMVGAFLALWMERPGQLSKTALGVLHRGGVAALCLIAVGFVTLGGPPHWMFDGGFLAITILAAVVIASVARPEHGTLGDILSLPPMQWIGKISYGLYLWHWPVTVFLTQQTTGLAGWAVDLSRVVLTLGLATVSFYVVEQPIRQRRIPALRGAPGLVAAGGGALAIILVLFTAVPIGAVTSTASARYPGVGPSVAGAGGFGDEVPIELPASVVIDHQHPLRVLVVGDSVMQLAQTGIAASLESTGVVSVTEEAFPGFALTPEAPINPPPEALPWRGADAFLGGLVTSLHPQLVIGTWSWDSAFAKKYPSSYRQMLNTTVRMLLSPGDGVFGVILLQMPVFGPIPKFLVPGFKQALPVPGPVLLVGHNFFQSESRKAAAVPVWNEAIALTPKFFPGRVMYLPVASSVERNDRFTNWLPPTNDPSAPRQSWVRVRLRDGEHLCPPGITRYAAAVLADLTSLFHLPPPKTHWWASSSIFSWTPVQEWCPNDHPRS
jgi:peptidoglycan/LPS O-acetylase OafA/YrhL